MKIKILKSAREDLRNSYWFYEKQEKRLGKYFLEAILKDIDSLKLNAGIHKIHFGKHRLLSRKFPYAVYYTQRNDIVYVHAILDCRQNPTSIFRRLNNI